MAPRKLIIDCDTGVDDAQAIMLALSRPDIELVALTCVHGNVGVDQVCLNTLHVLKVCGRQDIPVYKGAGKPLLGTGLEASHYHGEDGLGNSNVAMETDAGLLQSDHAVMALIRLVNQYPGEITLACLAPLTNIAMAIRLDPDFGKKLKDVLIMGGNIEGRCNCKAVCAEFNMAADPEAAFVVLEESNCTVKLVPWETCLYTGPSWDWFDNWTSISTEKGKLNKAIVQTPLNAQRRTGRPYYRSCDLFTMAIECDTTIALETEDVYCTVELSGKFTRGQMVVDWQQRLGKPPNVTIVRKLDIEKAKILFEEMLK